MISILPNEFGGSKGELGHLSSVRIASPRHGTRTASKPIRVESLDGYRSRQDFGPGDLVGAMLAGVEVGRNAVADALP